MKEACESSVGEILRYWRLQRRLTQLDLANAADVSARHVSFVENSRSRPTSDMILNLSEHLDIPLRDQNKLLLAAGFAPAYSELELAETPMAAISDAVNRILDLHNPMPAAAVDRRWELIAANEAIAVFTEDAADALLEPPINVLRLSLHPDGMAPRIVNLAQWRTHLLARLEREIRSGGDPHLNGLLDELRSYPGGVDTTHDTQSLIVPLRYSWRGQELSFFSTTTVFGSPQEVTVSELAIESFYPTDQATRKMLETMERRDS